MYCSSCGKPIPEAHVQCPACGTLQIGDSDPTYRAIAPAKGKSWVITLLLALLLPFLGIHRFYTGNIWQGVFHLLTGGGCGILWVVDMVLILFGGYRDGDNLPLQK